MRIGQTLRHAITHGPFANNRQVVFSGDHTETALCDSTAIIPVVCNNATGVFIALATVARHKIAETWTARLRAMLSLAVREDKRLPTERKGKRLSFECW